MRILVLSTWFPYPPDQGSRNRAYHLIRGLARRHTLALVSFQDRPLQPDWLEHMRGFCERIDIVQREPFHTTQVGRIKGWFSLQPSAVVAGYSPEMAERTHQVAEEWQPELVMAITFTTSAYALALKGIPRVIDVDNLLAGMLYEAIAQAEHPLEKARRYLAYWKFQRYELGLIRRFDRALVVSRRDEQRVRALLPGIGERLGLVPNGVDLETHAPGLCDPSDDSLVFNGALSYQPNFDAMDYFLREIFPLVQREVPHVQLSITGSTTGVPLDRLPRSPQVTFTGYLPDIRPAVAGSAVCVVPLRQGAGTRLKVLEAIALGTPVVSTSKGVEGLELAAGQHLLIADTPADFAAQTVRLLKDPALRAAISASAYQQVRAKYGWQAIGDRLCGLIAPLEKQADHV
jgi:polysaccharide biosynthesis protein PslH